MSTESKHNCVNPDAGGDNERPRISRYNNAPTFAEGEKVWLDNDGDREGPYIVAKLLPDGKCTLSHLDWVTPVNNGQAFDVINLERTG